MPEPIDWPPGTPEHIRNPIPHREPCGDCGLPLSEPERRGHDCPATTSEPGDRPERRAAPESVRPA